jgi:hypothetical protein
MKELLRSLSETNTPIALYSLGATLHVLHDFSDDPQKLKDAAAQVQQGYLPPDFAEALRDYGDITARSAPAAAADTHGRITVTALNRIIQHLSGIRGRKNLVWLAEISQIPPKVMALLQRANVVLYPVMVRCPPPGLAPCGFARPESQLVNRNLGTAFGGRGFFDAKDLGFALRAAQEDSSSAYVLGFYPPEDTLDGTYHKITVKLRNKTPEIHYRSGYLATKAAIPARAPIAPTLTELFEDPLVSSGIGLAAQAASEAQHPGLYDVRVTLDLRDIRLEHKDGHSVGAFELSVPNPSLKGTVTTGTVAIDLTDEQLAKALENGFLVDLTGVESESGEIRVVVRDRAAGTAGSLRVPVAKL